MFKSAEDALRYAQEHKIKMVDFKFVDLFGRWHHVTIPVSYLSEKTFAEGISFDSSSTPGFKGVEAGDMNMIPDPQSGMMDPFWEQPTLSFICSIYEADTHQEISRDPRLVATRAERYLQESGIADYSKWLPEFEFYIFNEVRYGNDPNSCGYFLDSEEGFWNTSSDTNGEGRNLGYIPRSQGGYHLIAPKDRFYNFRSHACQLIEDAANIPVKYHHHEVGGPGQCEIETDFGPMLKMADGVMSIKYILMNLAYQYDLSLTLMPKPLYHQAGSGMHFHQMLFKDGKPLFYDKDGYAQLSKTALYYIGGVLKHGRALLAFTNPSTNSYKRLVPGFEAPTKLFFGLANRSAAIRIPKHAPTPESKRFEFRPPDATANPYLAMSAMLMAGIDGIKNKIDPTEAGFGPFDENVFKWPKEKQDQLLSVPASLKEAMEALAEDHEFLLAGGVFDKALINTYIDYKMKEYYDVMSRPHPIEMELYYDL